MVAALVDAWQELGKPHAPVLVHGAARGADTMAAQLWRLWCWPTEPADWEHPAADLCLAFPLPDSLGSWEAVRRARAAGIPVRIAGPCAGRQEEAA